MDPTTKLYDMPVPVNSRASTDDSVNTTHAQPPTEIVSSTQMQQQPGKCNCQKSRCLKHYCECFAQGRRCQPSTCLCYQCLNLDEHQSSDVVKKAMRKQRSGHYTITQTLSSASVTSNGGDATPEAAAKLNYTDPTLANSSSNSNLSAPIFPGVVSEERRERQRNLGCTCKRSKCVRGYCDCFKLGMHCGPACKCVECCNTAEHAASSNFVGIGRSNSEIFPQTSAAENNGASIKSSAPFDRSKSFAFPNTSAPQNLLSSSAQFRRQQRRRILHAMRRTQSIQQQQSQNSANSSQISATPAADSSSSATQISQTSSGSTNAAENVKKSKPKSNSRESAGTFAARDSIQTSGESAVVTKSCKIHRRETRHAFLRTLKKKWGMRKRNRPTQLAARIDREVIDGTIDCVLAEAVVMPHNEYDVTKRMLRIFAECLQLVLDDNRSNFSNQSTTSTTAKIAGADG